MVSYKRSRVMQLLIFIFHDRNRLHFAQIGEGLHYQGCHQMREFRESQGILFSTRENQGKERYFEKSGNIREVIELAIVSF